MKNKLKNNIMSSVGRNKTNNNKFKCISNIFTLFQYNTLPRRRHTRRKAAVDDLAVKPVTQFPVEIDNEV